MFPILGCDLKWKNLEHKTRTWLRKVASKEPAKKMATASGANRAHKSGQARGQNPNPRLFLRLHDINRTRDFPFGKPSRFVDRGDGTVTQVRTLCWTLEERQDFVNSEQLAAIANARKVRGGGVGILIQFFKGTRYLSKSYVLGSFGPKKKKKGMAKRARMQFVYRSPICIIPDHVFPRRSDGGAALLHDRNLQECNWQPLNRDHPRNIPFRMTLLGILMIQVFSNINLPPRRETWLLWKGFESGIPVDMKDNYYKTPLNIHMPLETLMQSKFLLEKGMSCWVQFRFWEPSTFQGSERKAKKHSTLEFK